MKISLGTLEKPGFLEFFQKSENFMQKKLKKGLTFSTVDYIIIKQVGDRPTAKTKKWNLSSAGRASALQAEGHRFEPCRFHMAR